MKNSYKTWLSLLLVALLFAVGCGKKENPSHDAPKGSPVFHLDYSEYASWSVFGAQDLLKRIDGAEGKVGPIEEKYKIDIVLHKRDYVPSLTSYGNKSTDAVTVTNIDILAFAQGRDSVAILPTSRSHGADGILVEKSITDIDGLKGVKVYGAAASVSEYMFRRCIEQNGKDPKDFSFVDMDPGNAASQVQSKAAEIRAVALWNPELKQSLASRDDVHILCDSTKLPDEILDMVVIGKDSLAKEGGDRFAQAIAETYYDFSKQLADPAKKDKALRALSKHFLNLEPAVIEELLKQTQFYETPEKGQAAFTKDHLKPIMKTVSKTWIDAGHIKKAPSIGHSADKELFFDSSHMKAIK